MQRAVLFVLLALALPAAAAPDLDLTATREGTQIRVFVAGGLFTCYKFAPELKYPYFWPVNGPATGQSVTTETSDPYPHHHSLFFGCDRVSGGNYWQEPNERGQIVSQGPRIVEAAGKRIVIEDTCRWQRPGAPDPFGDKRTIVVTAPAPNLRCIDFTVTLTAASPVQILKNNHSLFSARMVPELSVKGGGRLVNAEGAEAEKGTFGAKSPWCDYAGKRGEAMEGLAILQWPKNRWHPAPWFTRDYGFFSPTPMFWLEPEGVRFAPGETLTLRYRVVVHAGDAKEADIAGIFERWSAEAK